MEITYQLQLDFASPAQDFTDTLQVYKKLKSEGHISVYDTTTEKYQQMAKEFCTTPGSEPFYIETSVSAEGVFVQSIENWINDHMVDEFYNPEKRPYIEKYVSH